MMKIGHCMLGLLGSAGSGTLLERVEPGVQGGEFAADSCNGRVLFAARLRPVPVPPVQVEDDDGADDGGNHVMRSFSGRWSRARPRWPQPAPTSGAGPRAAHRDPRW